jgi:hypothetical protein
MWLIAAGAGIEQPNDSFLDRRTRLPTGAALHDLVLTGRIPDKNRR